MPNHRPYVLSPFQRLRFFDRPFPTSALLFRFVPSGGVIVASRISATVFLYISVLTLSDHNLLVIQIDFFLRTNATVPGMRYCTLGAITFASTSRMTLWFGHFHAGAD